MAIHNSTEREMGMAKVYIVCDSQGNPMVPFKTMKEAVEYNKRHGGGYRIIVRQQKDKGND